MAPKKAAPAQEKVMLGRPGNNLKSGIVCELGPPTGPSFLRSSLNFFFFFPLYKWVFLFFSLTFSSFFLCHCHSIIP